ncbi:MAG: hypothetical protein ACOYYS_00280 [Chloroflexota bacterium]
MRLHPDELRQIAAHFRSLGNQWDAVNERLCHAWERLDAGWTSYAGEEIGPLYTGANHRLTQMGDSLYQAAWVLEAAAAWIEDADLHATASFTALQDEWGMLPKPTTLPT